MSMVRVWRDQGKREEARELLGSVYGWFTEGFDTRDLKEAKKLLDELASWGGRQSWVSEVHSSGNMALRRQSRPVHGAGKYLV